VPTARAARVYHLDSGACGAYVALRIAGVAKFGRENATGLFEVEVALAGEVRYQAHFTNCKLAAMPVQAAARAARDTDRRVTEGQVQARQDRQELLPG